MQLFLHDSRTRARQPLVPIDPHNVRIYVCGPTVYDRAHIGNARTFLIYDALVRLLRHLFPHVTYVRNITDVDDKINARAQQQNVPINQITDQTTRLFHQDMHALGVLPPDAEPAATAHIPEMLSIIERLIANGHAYAAAGHVLFSVESFPGYGALSGRDPDALLAGARVDPAPYKRDPGDFVLWKPSAPELPGWDSPWGRGRPGWHIECSAMSWKYLGDSFDIHGGGHDLMFPHHENECAQSLCAFPHSGFANLWLHNGMLRRNGEKMSKSLGNVTTIEQVLAVAPAEAVRLCMLGTHYRAELDLTDSALAEARTQMDRFYRAIGEPTQDACISQPFLAALCDDFNTPRAIAELHRLATLALAGDPAAAAQLRAAGRLLGLFALSAPEWFRGDRSGLEEDDVQQAIADRAAAKRSKDWARADQIREDLRQKGILLEDTATGTSWRRA